MKLPEFNSEQINRLSEIYMGIGHIALASIAIPALIDRLDPGMIILSLATAIYFWTISVFIVRRENDKY